LPAWDINTSAHELSDYPTCKAGFDRPQGAALAIDRISGDNVSVSFIAYQTDG